MSQWNFAVNFFVALFALIDPIGNAPLFAAVTPGVKGRERAQLSALVALFAVGFLAFFYFTGIGLLQFFGISLPAFRLAGGVILFLLGLEMVRDDFTAKLAETAKGATPADKKAQLKKRLERTIVPFAMPLLIGPGAISTVVIYASQGKDLGAPGLVAGLGVIAAMGVAILLSLLATPLITRLLGDIGLTIVVRVLGLILTAMAVQFMIAGLADATHGFIRHEAAAPYPVKTSP